MHRQFDSRSLSEEVNFRGVKKVDRTLIDIEQIFKRRIR
jgi:hypothetical protein